MLSQGQDCGDYVHLTRLAAWSEARSPPSTRPTAPGPRPEIRRVVPCDSLADGARALITGRGDEMRVAYSPHLDGTRLRAAMPSSCTQRDAVERSPPRGRLVLE